MRKKQELSIYIFSFIVYIYLIASSIFYLLPPMLGFFFILLIINFKKNGFDKNSLLIVLYFSLFEITHGMFLFSCLCVFLIFYYNLYDKLVYKLKNRELLVFIIILFVYITVLYLNAIFAFVFELDYVGFSYIFIYYICFETLLSTIIFRGLI